MIEPRKIFGGLGNRMFQGAYLLSQIAKSEIPDVYMQDEKYFVNVKDKVKELYGREIIPSDYVSLHIRRGDYVNNPFYVDLCSTDYYQKAVAEFADDKFLVFCADRQAGSDDEEDRYWTFQWLKTFIPEDRLRLSISNDEITDFNNMAGCKGHVMANSSFSWWASYVGGGKVVAPLQWFSDGKQRVGLLDEWKKI